MSQIDSSQCFLTMKTCHTRAVEHDDPGPSIPGILRWILGPGTCIPDPPLCVLSPIIALPHLGEFCSFLLVTLHLFRVILATRLPPSDYILPTQDRRREDRRGECQYHRCVVSFVAQISVRVGSYLHYVSRAALIGGHSIT